MQNLCALYLRVSTDQQADHGVSLPAQQSRLMSYIKAQGWDLHKVYTDDGYSGKDLKRPAMTQLLKDAKQGKFNRVVVIKLDRISRSQKDALYLIEDVFDKNGITFTSVSESFDTSTPFGKASLGMLSVFAQLEREMIVERVLTAKKECAKQGRYLGGFIPYGYTYDSNQKKYAIEPITAHTVRLIFDTYVTGQFSFNGIAEMLEIKKIPTHKGGKYWDKTTIRQILINPVYIGKMRHKGQIHNGKHDPIISEEQFDKANAMIKKQYVKPPTREDDNLLTGFIYCGNCNSRMRFKTNNWKSTKKIPDGKVWTRQYYVCYTQFDYKHTSKSDGCDCGFKKVENVNQSVIDYLFMLANNVSEMDEKIKQTLAINTDTDNDKESIQNELDKINKKIDRWYDAYENEDIKSDELNKRVALLRSQQTDLEYRLSIIEESENIAHQRSISMQGVKGLLQQFPKLWDNSTPTERRALLARTVGKVTVYKDNTIDVDLAI